MAHANINNRQPKSKLTLEPHQIILRPLVTEKGIHRSTRHNQYAFQVNPLADKISVREAIEILYPNVKVTKVATQNRIGKNRRYRNRLGQTKKWKKAIVTLDPEHGEIEFF
jgi:large subunit ribosomal protein L23